MTPIFPACRRPTCKGIVVVIFKLDARGPASAREEADPGEVTGVVLSEIYHNVIQMAGCRSCRTTKGGGRISLGDDTDSSEGRDISGGSGSRRQGRRWSVKIDLVSNARRCTGEGRGIRSRRQ